MNKKYDNNNIIIASRAYFLQIRPWARGVIDQKDPAALDPEVASDAAPG
jgi:hypothetical protein